MTQTITEILVLAAWAYSTACLTYLYDFCIGSVGSGSVAEGRVFSALGRWLDKHYTRHEAANIKHQRRWLNWTKVVGVCPTCTNVWLTFVTFPLAVYLFGAQWHWFLPFVVVSNRWLRQMFR